MTLPPSPEGRCPQLGGLCANPGLGAAVTCMLGEAVTGFGESRLGNDVVTNMGIVNSPLERLSRKDAEFFWVVSATKILRCNFSVLVFKILKMNPN